MHSTPTSESETNEPRVSVVANRLEDQPLAEALTAVISALWDRLPISALMSAMLMDNGRSATDMDQDVRSIIESALFSGSASPQSNRSNPTTPPTSGPAKS